MKSIEGIEWILSKLRNLLRNDVRTGGGNEANRVGIEESIEVATIMNSVIEEL